MSMTLPARPTERRAPRPAADLRVLPSMTVGALLDATNWTNRTAPPEPEPSAPAPVVRAAPAPAAPAAGRAPPSPETPLGVFLDTVNWRNAPGANAAPAAEPEPPVEEFTVSNAFDEFAW